MRYTIERMNAGAAVHDARTRAGLSQAELARRVRTSQAAVWAYERGAKQPSVATFSRLLAAAGARLAVEHSTRRGRRRPLTEPAPAELRRAGETLAQVIRLAEALPVEHAPRL